MTSSIAQLAALSRIFSPAVFRQLAKKGRSETFAHLLKQSGVKSSCSHNATVGEAFDAAFAHLKTVGRRDEYVFRAAVTHKILIGKHSLNTACMLNEFRAGNCKADLVILNGTATAFEIKSERDGLSRLGNQIANYSKVFAAVNVITCEGHIKSVLEIVPKETGILCLSQRYQISTVREAANQPERTCPGSIFASLRMAEAQEILRQLGKEVPNLPNTQIYGALRDLFETLDPVDVQRTMVATLKRTRDLAPLHNLIARLPQSLHATALSVQVKRSEHLRLIDAIATPLAEASAWV